MINKTLSRLMADLPPQARYYYYYSLLGRLQFPEIVHIENTNACNAKCIMCPRDKMKRAVGFMDFDLFRKIVDECSDNKELKEVHLHGYGEPLLDARLIDRIIYAKKKKIKKLYFVTNASLLTKEYSRALINAGIDAIKFSIYGNSPQTYEAIHSGLKFDVVKENVLEFFRLRKELKAKSLSAKIQFLPLDANKHERDAFFRRWEPIIDKKRGDAVQEFQIHNWIYGRDYHSVDADTSKKRSCVIPFFSLQILWNGDVTACCWDYDGKMKFGNVSNKSIFQIWNGDEFSDFLQSHRRGKFQLLNVCNMCDQLKLA